MAVLGAPGGLSQAERGGTACIANCGTCARLRSALLDALLEQELESVTAEDLERRAGVPATTFAAHYATLDDCVVATCDEVSVSIYRVLADEFAGPGEWQDRFARGITASLGCIESTPGASKLCFAETTCRHAHVRAHRSAHRERMVALLADEYERDHAAGLPHLYFEFMLGALYRAAQDEVAAGRAPSRIAGRVSELVAVLEPAGAAA